MYSRTGTSGPVTGLRSGKGLGAEDDGRRVHRSVGRPKRSTVSGTSMYETRPVGCRYGPGLNPGFPHDGGPNVKFPKTKGRSTSSRDRVRGCRTNRVEGVGDEVDAGGTTRGPSSKRLSLPPKERRTGEERDNVVGCRVMGTRDGSLPKKKKRSPLLRWRTVCLKTYVEKSPN